MNSQSQSSIELSIAQERLRQARYSFNLAIFATAVSFFISLVGAGILLSNKIPQGTVLAAGGLVSAVEFQKLSKDANDRLDKILLGEEDN
ncbi:MAG: hypothetical protein AAF915_15760 [Cyanobacteria bacterium P01_D01_bin.50]